MAGITKKLAALARLVRIEHSFMLAAAVIIAAIISRGALPAPDSYLLLALVPPFFISIASFALNDCLDLESDRINRRKDRPLVTGDLSQKTAILIAIISFTIGVTAAFLLPAPTSLPLAIALLFSLLALAYNYSLKDRPLVGNIYIASTMAIPFIYGSFLFSPSLPLPIISLALIAFLSGLGREIVKSTEDMEGDKKARKSKTLPLIVGAKNASLSASLVFFLFVLLAPSPFLLGVPAHPLALALVLLADLAFLYMAVKLLSPPPKSELRFMRKLSLASLAAGLLGYLLAVLL